MKKIIGKKIQEYWNHWCKHLCDSSKKKEYLKKDLFPGVKLEPELDVVTSDEE